MYLLSSSLRDIWYESLSSEVHIKAKHIPVFPWGEDADWPKDDEPYQNCYIEVAQLCHVTHLEQFQQIRQPAGRSVKYELKPLMKMGKEGRIKEGCLIGASYTPSSPAAISPNYRIIPYTPYRIVPPTEPILPGHYIWWSVNQQYTGEHDDEDKYDLSDMFSDPPTSIYGSKKISVMSFYLFRSYQAQFFQDGKYPMLEFRNGGTLRYKREICYVTIVCAQGQFKGPLDKQYPQVEGFPITYNNDGSVYFVTKWKINIRNGIKAINGKAISWDHHVLAFHYPNGGMRMILQQGNVKEEKVEHNFCLKGRYINGKFICPDRAHAGY